jgi:hypothetical protein
MYACYYAWVSRGRPRDASLFFYCLFATCYSIYACAWVRGCLDMLQLRGTMTAQDFLVDWSVLRMHCKHPFLREELLAPDYFAVRWLLFSHPLR